MAERVLNVASVTKLYQMGDVQVHALRGVDLSLSAGELVVVLGPSGSGKSTLVNILGGLDVPTSGRVVYHDHDLTEADDEVLTHYRRAHVGFADRALIRPTRTPATPRHTYLLKQVSSFFHARAWLRGAAFLRHRFLWIEFRHTKRSNSNDRSFPGLLRDHRARCPDRL